MAVCHQYVGVPVIRACTAFHVLPVFWSVCSSATVEALFRPRTCGGYQWLLAPVGGNHSVGASTTDVVDEIRRHEVSLQNL